LETNTTQLTMLPDRHSRRLPSQQEPAGDPGQGSMWRRRNPKTEWVFRKYVKTRKTRPPNLPTLSPPGVANRDRTTWTEVKGRRKWRETGTGCLKNEPQWLNLYPPSRPHRACNGITLPLHLYGVFLFVLEPPDWIGLVAIFRSHNLGYIFCWSCLCTLCS
jgi:hypothetical protein